MPGRDTRFGMHSSKGKGPVGPFPLSFREGGSCLESAKANQKLLSASGMIPSHFLSQEDIGYSLRREFFL